MYVTSIGKVTIFYIYSLIGDRLGRIFPAGIALRAGSLAAAFASLSNRAAFDRGWGGIVVGSMPAAITSDVSVETRPP